MERREKARERRDDGEREKERESERVTFHISTAEKKALIAKGSSHRPSTSPVFVYDVSGNSTMRALDKLHTFCTEIRTPH